MDQYSLKKIISKVYQYRANQIGIIKLYAGTTVPSGWLLCNGAAISRTTYSQLYSKIQDIYGEGDGSTTFNIPNLIDKFPMGTETSAELASTGGTTSSIIPAHTHKIAAFNLTTYTTGHTHRWRQTGKTLATASYSDVMRNASTSYPISWYTNAPSLAHTHNIPAHNTNATGDASDVAESNLPSYVGLYYIIYTGVYS